MRRLATILSLTTVLASGTALAHPHVFVDSNSKVVFDAKGRIVAVQHRWTFDDAFSSFAVQGLDENGDGAYSREELMPLAQVNVESLAEFDFFTSMAVDEMAYEFRGPRDYWLDLEDTQLVLNFTLPLKTPVAVDGVPVELDVYDPEYFVSFEMQGETSVALANAPEACFATVKAPALDAIDATTKAQLASISPDERFLPDDLRAVTATLSNTATINCGFFSK